MTQQLLVRALVAWFWSEPYTRAPIAGARELHDRFMLPHFVAARFPRRARRSAPRRLSVRGATGSRRISSFAFPSSAASNYAGIDLELRQAIEPWHVLGEEPAGGGTARYVDSSVERLQVKVDGLTGDRYVVTCNGRRVAAAPDRRARRIRRGRALPRLAAAFVPASDDPGAYAAGVRRARHLDRALDRRLHLSRRASRRAQLRRPSRSTPTRPKPAAPRGSSRSATRRGPHGLAVPGAESAISTHARSAPRAGFVDRPATIKRRAASPLYVDAVANRAESG